MFRPAYLFLIALILIPCISHAKTETIFADHKYVMGDTILKTMQGECVFLKPSGRSWKRLVLISKAILRQRITS
jgi:hypothetical protein